MSQKIPEKVIETVVKCWQGKPLGDDRITHYCRQIVAAMEKEWQSAPNKRDAIKHAPDKDTIQDALKTMYGRNMQVAGCIDRIRELTTPSRPETSKHPGKVVNISQEPHMHMGDDIKIDGDITNAVVGIKAKLENVHLTIEALPTEDPKTKKELSQLVTQLREELEKVPKEQAQAQENASKVAKQLERLLEEVKKTDTDEEEKEYRKNRFLKAAENIQAVLPMVVTIATNIVEKIGEITGNQ